MKPFEINIPISNNVTLQSMLNIPAGAKSLVIFSHGSGSSRFNQRNNYVAELFRNQPIATLLIDLLTENEDRVYENRFDIDLLTDRLVKATLRAQQFSELENFNIGYFGASTGAALALQAAAQLGESIYAVVSRGGRPDLAKNIDQVKAPTLLIAGSLDKNIIKLNEQVYDLLNCEKEIKIIPGASHLFEEKGKLDEVARLSSEWFGKYLLQPNSQFHAIR